MSSSVLAVGAWLKNAACLLLDGQPHWSPVHGDLSDPQACVALERSLQALLQQAPERALELFRLVSCFPHEQVVVVVEPLRFCGQSRIRS